jgi:hypothetical protein
VDEEVTPQAVVEVEVEVAVEEAVGGGASQNGLSTVWSCSGSEKDDRHKVLIRVANEEEPEAETAAEAEAVV